MGCFESLVSSGLSVSVDESGWDDLGDTVGTDPDLPAAIFRPVTGFTQIVMMRTQQHQIRQARRATSLPGLDVVGVTIGRRPVTAREDTSLVAGVEGVPDIGGDQPLLAADIQRCGVAAQDDLNRPDFGGDSVIWFRPR